MRVLFLFPLAALLLLSAGCAGEEAKPNRDSVLTMNILATVEKIFDRYQEKKFGEMEDYVSRAFTFFRPETRFHAVKLEHDVRRVRIEGDVVQVVVGWTGTWTLRPGMDVSGGGQCTLVFSAGTGRLTGLEGDSPFSIPGPAPGGGPP